ncbi:hypothetical protein CI610_02588 [invertebrate metagenome]|uniref:Uncharacterized protein n=2 Tax=root TaxID=1 RepID=A0A2H9T5H3_9ZZZZ
MRHKFWTSLRSDKLKSQTRHKYDTITSFNELLREIRIVEKELNISSTAGASQPKKGHQHAISVESDPQIASVTEMEDKFVKKLESLEQKNSQLESKLDKILNKLGSQSTSDKADAGQRSGQNKGRGRGGYNKSRGRGKWNNKGKAKNEDHPN